MPTLATSCQLAGSNGKAHKLAACGYEALLRRWSFTDQDDHSSVNAFFDAAMSGATSLIGKRLSIVNGRVVLSLADQSFDSGQLGVYLETAEGRVSEIQLDRLACPSQTDEHLASG